MGGAGGALASVDVSPRFSTSGLVASGTMEDVVVMSGSSVTCLTSSGGGGASAGDITSVGASGSGVGASIPAGAGATGLAICCGISSGGTSMGPPPGLRLGGRRFHLWQGRGGGRVGEVLRQNW